MAFQSAAPPRAKGEPRGARRRRETHQKLLNAAFQLMAERGVDGVSINEITELADVGIGSFYNHFATKEALHAELLDRIFEEFADALDHLVKSIDDPAESMAICLRHTINRARREPQWGRFLLREALSSSSPSRGLGARMLRDIRIGIEKGRFSTPDPVMSFIMVGGGTLGAISAALQADALQNVELPQLDFCPDDIPERAVTMLLHELGLSFDQAREIAHRPLPIVGPRSSSS